MATRLSVVLFLALGAASGLGALEAAPPATDPKVQKPGQTPAEKPAKPSHAEKLGKYFEDRVELPASATPTTGRQIVSILGDPKPFQLQATGRYILIYCRASGLKDCDSLLLAKIKSDIKRLAGGAGTNPPPSSYEEITVSHSGALGDVAAKAKSLNFSALHIEAVGSDKIRVRKNPGASQADYTKQVDDFKRDLDHIAWQIEPESPVARVYYVDAASAARALGGNAPAGGGAPVKKDTPPADQGSAGPDQKAADASPAAAPETPPTGKPAPDKAGSGADKNKGKPAGAAPQKPVKKDAPPPAPASASAPAPAPAPAADNPPKDNPAPETGEKDPENPQPAPANKPGKDDGGGSDSSDMKVFDPDLLVFTTKHPGDDSAIAERKRILAGIDFPRPEVIINTFSFQTSSSDSTVLSQQDRILRSHIGAYNDSIQGALYRTWFYLERRMATPNFFYKPFYEYLTRRFVGDSLKVKGAGGADAYTCGPTSYCLGYTSLFQPLRPILTDMLFAAIASADPASEFRRAIEHMQGFAYLDEYPGFAATGGAWGSLTCDERDIAAWKAPNQLPPITADHSADAADGQSQDAATQDATQPRASWQITTATAIARRLSTPGQGSDPRVFPMFCFREAIEGAYPVAASGASYSDTNLGLPLRAALANFLFHYKMSQQYPHEFSPYDLSQSAQELNSELNPLIVAFNRDLAAALQPLQDVADLNVKGKGSHHGTGKTKFVNNGIITVRTVSGKQTTVDTVTQNFFDATNPPSITDIITSIGQAESNTPKVLKANLTANEAAVVIGALNSVKPTTAQVGRQFLIDIMPRSLNGASSAELNIYLKTSDVGKPVTYSNGKTDNDNLSRVALQTVNTKIRLESVKLFEITSFAATLQRSRRNFPILPPLVEIPYIGSILSWPVAGATQYHRSTAIMSAVVVPTAADLASGVEFTSDRVWFCDNDTGELLCRPKRTLSQHDIDGVEPRAFNKLMVRCFAEAHPEAACSNPRLVLPSE